MLEYKLCPVSRRLIEALEPIAIATQLNKMAQTFKDSGWNIKRGIAGTVILELQDGEVHLIPSVRGIEEIIFERRAHHE